MSIRVYTVLAAYAGGRGIRSIEQRGIYHNIDTAYLTFKRLVEEKQPKESLPYVGRLSIRETAADAAQIKEVARIRRQLKEMRSEVRLEGMENWNFDQDMIRQIEELYPDYDDMTNAEFDEVRLSINPNYFNILRERQENGRLFSEKRNNLLTELEAMQNPDRIIIEKVDGEWGVAGGYYIDAPGGAFYFDYLFPENEVEATASFEDGTEGWRFYILKSDLY